MKREIAALGKLKAPVKAGAAKDGQKYGYLYARKAIDAPQLIVQEFQPQWDKMTSGFTNDA